MVRIWLWDDFGKSGYEHRVKKLYLEACRMHGHNQDARFLLRHLRDFRSAVMSRKCDDYASSADRWRNFRAASALSGMTQPHCVEVFALKHMAAIENMLNNPEKPESLPNILEKFGDLLNYNDIRREIVK